MPEELNDSEPIVSLNDGAMEDGENSAGIGRCDPGSWRRSRAFSALSQPIQQRVDELISGVRAECAIKLFGEDLDVCTIRRRRLPRSMQQINGVKDIKVEQISGQPYLTVDIDRQKIARFGINVADVQEIITTAIGGKAATHVYEGERRFQLTLRFPELQRNSIGTIREIRVKSASGALIPMSELATIELREGPLHQPGHVKRRIYVGFNVRARHRQRRG